MPTVPPIAVPPPAAPVVGELLGGCNTDADGDSGDQATVPFSLRLCGGQKAREAGQDDEQVAGNPLRTSEVLWPNT